MKNKTEYIFGFILLAVVLILGATGFDETILMGRLIIGLGIGYVLTRAYYGFAGTANRAYNAGSTKLMRSFMMLMIIGSLVTVFFAANREPGTLGLFIHPVTLGTVIGSFMFGVGMAFAGGCASGVLTDMTSEFPKALLALLTFGGGFLLGMPIKRKMPWLVNESVISTGDHNGVFFPDLFKFDGFNGYLGAFILTFILAMIVIKISYSYEAKRKREGTYSEIPSEVEQEKEAAKLFDENLSWYERFFARPWTLFEGAIGMAIMLVALYGIANQAWGVSGAFGFWFSKLINTLGVSTEAIESWAGVDGYLDPTIFTHQQSVQDIGIILGSFIAMLTMGRLAKTFKPGLKTSGKKAMFALLGGLLMGISIGISKGCNAGGLFSPIVSFSLSGWIFLVFMVLGAALGNKIKNSAMK